MLFVKLSQEVYNKMPKLPSEDTLLMTARIMQVGQLNLKDSLEARIAWCQLKS